MRKKIGAYLCVGMLTCAMLAGCGTKDGETGIANDGTTVENESVSDKEAADNVAKLIDAIYVQTRTEDTDTLCAEAKAAWDALTDEQKELVEGENADPDYFGRDTGDASKDNPLNGDDIGENELLVVSFGTSFNDSRTVDIGSIEKALQEAYPEWSVRRAFTAQIIINHVQARDGEKIDNMEQALERAVANEVKNLVVQPTHLMHGAEYDELCTALKEYEDKFDFVSVAEPLLGEVGEDAGAINSDKEAVAKAITDEAVKEAGYAGVTEASEAGVAFVLLGHGTSHTAKVTYSQMQTQMDELGYKNVFIGTVEGEPEETACEEVIEAVKQAGYSKVILRPLMVVAGDHANNDMAGDDEDSWKSMFEAAGVFESVEAQITGLGGIKEIQDICIAHAGDAINKLDNVTTDDGTANEGVANDGISTLEDGVYDAYFDTDSSMFHVNEACEGKGVLTVNNGEMTIHISLTSQNILNLYPGLAEDAQEEGATLLQPTLDTVTYSDGTTEEVNGFDVPVPYLNDEFDLALIGSKGKWYDHKVSVSVCSSNSDKTETDTVTTDLEDGEYEVEILLEGGTGKATVSSPARLVVSDGKAYCLIEWSSSNYDYMIVDGEKYLPINDEGNSVFEIPVVELNSPVNVVADTTAMSVPHEIDYTLTFIYK